MVAAAGFMLRHESMKPRLVTVSSPKAHEGTRREVADQSLALRMEGEDVGERVEDEQAAQTLVRHSRHERRHVDVERQHKSVNGAGGVL